MSQKMSLNQVLAPQLQQSLNLLQAPMLELKAMVDQELQLNPVLEEQAALDAEAREKGEPVEGDEAKVDLAEPPSDTQYDPTDESTAGKAAYRSGDFQLGMGAGGAIIPDPDAVIGGLYAKTASYNASQWETPRLTEIFDLQARELDQDKRRELLLEAADIMMLEDTQWVGLYWKVEGKYVDNSIQNYNAPASSASELKFEHTWCDPAC